MSSLPQFTLDLDHVRSAPSILYLESVSIYPTFRYIMSNLDLDVVFNSPQSKGATIESLRGPGRFFQQNIFFPLICTNFWVSMSPAKFCIRRWSQYHKYTGDPGKKIQIVFFSSSTKFSILTNCKPDYYFIKFFAPPPIFSNGTSLTYFLPSLSTLAQSGFVMHYFIRIEYYSLEQTLSYPRIKLVLALGLSHSCLV